MKVYFAADHAGFELKHELLTYVRGELGLEVENCGAFEYDTADDYPQIIAIAARALSEDAANEKGSRAILIGASGQGEAMVANRFSGVRACVYYGPAAKTQTDVDGRVLDIVTSSRVHNDANALALGARFISTEEAKKVVHEWLVQVFTRDPRHVRRIEMIDTVAKQV